VISAVRGAICVASDTKEAISEAVQKLYVAVLEANDLKEADIAALLITQTSDLKALNPATGLRMGKLGSSIALFCMNELEIEGMMAQVIRMLFLLKGDHSNLTPIYLDGAEKLRPDLVSQ